MPVQLTLEAKVKDSYNMGPVFAFSGHEYVRTEWRPVPVGFEPAALAHPLLDVREVGGEEIHVTAKDHLVDTLGTADLKVANEAVTTETPEGETTAEESKPTKRRARKSKATDEEE